MGRLKAANAAARLVATPGSVVSTCPSLPASSAVISPSTAAMSALNARQRAMLRPSRAARAAASAGGGRQVRHRSIQNSASLARIRPWARASTSATRQLERVIRIEYTTGEGADTMSHETSVGLSVTEKDEEETSTDTEPTDTQPTDTGPTDTEPTDTGPTDTGPTDTGPTGEEDSTATTSAP